MINILFISLIEIFSCISAQDYEDPLYFKRGFLYSVELPKIIPPHYRKVASHLWLDRIVNLGISRDKKVYVFGVCVDIRDANTNLTTIANNLASALKQSGKKFFDEEEYLAGRYVIIYTVKGKTKILSDALGVRSIYHSSDGKIVAGHAKLVADNLAGKVVGKQTLDSVKSVGRFTPYRNVFILIPNTFLELGSTQIDRFYPRAPLQPMSHRQAGKIVIPWLKNVIRGAASIKPLAVGLTGGKDSRTTMSLCKSMRLPIFFFTYLSKKGLRAKDVPVAVEIANILGLNHRVINQPSESLSKHTYDIVTTNAYHRSTPKAVEVFARGFGADNYIFIHSLYESVCAKPKRYVATKQEINDWCYQTALNEKRLDPDSKQLNSVAQVVNDYLKVSKMCPVQIFNFHPSDLYYTEQCSLALKSQQHLEADLAYDSIIPSSSRAILRTMVQASRGELMPGSDKVKIEFAKGRNINLLRYIMNTLAPEIAEVPLS